MAAPGELGLGDPVVEGVRASTWVSRSEFETGAVDGGGGAVATVAAAWRLGACTSGVWILGLWTLCVWGAPVPDTGAGAGDESVADVDWAGWVCVGAACKGAAVDTAAASDALSEAAGGACAPSDDGSGDGVAGAASVAVSEATVSSGSTCVGVAVGVFTSALCVDAAPDAATGRVLDAPSASAAWAKDGGVVSDEAVEESEEIAVSAPGSSELGSETTKAGPSGSGLAPFESVAAGAA